MKKILLSILVAGMTAGMAHGQGAITFANLGSGSALTTPTSVNAPVYNTDGTTKLAGTGYSIQLFYGTPGTAANALTAFSTILTFNNAPFNGYTATSPNITIPSFAIGSTIQVQLRAWNNQSGTVTSYAAAAIKGVSNSFVSAPLGDPTNPGSIPVLQGLTSFQLGAVPEPSTVVLGVLGAAALLFRRKKSA